MPKHHVWGWYPPQTTSYIHVWHVQNVWAIGMFLQGHMGAPLYHYTGHVGPRFGKSTSLEEWQWCHNLMVEADIHLRPLGAHVLQQMVTERRCKYQALEYALYWMLEEPAGQASWFTKSNILTCLTLNQCKLCGKQRCVSSEEPPIANALR
jgi:hypothetical protein